MQSIYNRALFPYFETFTQCDEFIEIIWYSKRMRELHPSPPLLPFFICSFDSVLLRISHTLKHFTIVYRLNHWSISKYVTAQVSYFMVCLWLDRKGERDSWYWTSRVAKIKTIAKSTCKNIEKKRSLETDTHLLEITTSS